MIKFLFLALFIFSKAIIAQEKNYSISDKYSLENFSKMKIIHNHLQKVKIYDIEYRSTDNLKIKGFLIEPNNLSEKYPVVIYNRGGNGGYGMVSEPFIVNFLSKIASSGFIVIGSQLRGSQGSEGVDEFGGKDINDVNSLFNIIKNLKNADTTKIAQIGWSRGGITNFQMLKKTNKIKTTINIAGPSDILSTKRKEMFKVYQNRIKNYSLDSIYYSKKVSPIFQIDSILNKKESFLFLHGDNDDKVDISNSLDLFEKTCKSGFYSEIIIFKNEDHNLFNQKEKLIQDIITWLKKRITS